MASASGKLFGRAGPSPPETTDVESHAVSHPPPAPGADAAELNYQPRTLHFWAVIVCIFLALFLVALDRTIIGTAVPQITREFNSLGDIGWYGSSYQLTTAASQLVFGRIYRFYETKRTFLWSILVFEVGSVICGAAPSSVVFIVGRSIAGVGGAGIFSGVMIIMIPMVPLRKRPMFQGVFGTVFGVASVLGPLVGGGFTDSVSWRWCFYINLPIGGVAALCLIFVLHLPPWDSSSSATLWEQFVRLDPLGVVFLVPSVACLVLALQWGGSTYSWNSWRIILLMVIFAVLFLAFGLVQYLLPKTATVPVRVIGKRSILAGTVFMFCLAGSMLMVIFFMPLWFQVVQGVSATDSGIYTLPFVLSLVIGSVTSGGLTTKLGYYVPAMLISPSLMAIGQGLMSTFRVNEYIGRWVGFQTIAGLGLGFGMQASGLAAQAVLPKPDIPTGIAVIFFSQQLGGAIFTSVGQNLLSSSLMSQIASLPGVDPSQVMSQGAGDLVNSVAPELREQVKEIYNSAISRIFLCAMGVALAAVVAALFMEWKNIKKTGPHSPPPDKLGKGKATPLHPSPRTLTPHGTNDGTACGSPDEKHVTSFKGGKPEEPLMSTATTPLGDEKAGCDHCDHCRLSRAMTVAASEDLNRLSRAPTEDMARLSRLSRMSQTETINYQSRPTTLLMDTTTATAATPELEEAARLAGVARDALRQIEELTRAFPMSTMIGTALSTDEYRSEPASRQQESPRAESSSASAERFQSPVNTSPRHSSADVEPGPSAPPPAHVAARSSQGSRPNTGSSRRSFQIHDFPSPSQIPYEENR